MGPSLPPSGLSVQAQEKLKRKETNRVASRKRTERRKEQLLVREAQVAMAATAKDGAYESYVNLVGDLKQVTMDFERQTAILGESGVVRWREHRTLSFDVPRNCIVYNPPRHERCFVMQISIRSTDTVTVWEDFFEVKASKLKTKSAGLGLFARRHFKKGDIISLYAGVSFDPSK